MSFWIINTVIVILVLLVIRSGFRGESVLIKTGSWTLAPLILLGVPYVHGWGGAVIWLAAMFVGYMAVVVSDSVNAGKLPYNFTSKQDGFQINFPKKPKIIDSHDYSRQYIVKTVMSYVVTVYDLAAMTRTQKQIKDELRLAVNRVSSAFGIFEPEFTEAEILGIPCINATYQMDNGRSYYYLVLIKNNKLYELTLSLTGEGESLIANFVNSFRFIQ